MSEESGASEVVQDDASIVAEAVSAPAETPQEAIWHYAEGVPGQGDKPEFLKEKYANVTEQAKAYTELESKFGSFTGAPEEYGINLSEELKEGGLTIDESDPLMEEAVSFAKESNMSQDGFDKMINLYAMSKMADAQVMEDHKEQELKALGNNGQVRIDNLNSWANTNLPEDMVQGFQEMATSASAVQALEKLVAMTRSAPVNPGGDPAPGGISEEEVNKLAFEKDDHGNRRMATDPAFRKKVEAMQARLYGTEDHRIVIGAK